MRQILELASPILDFHRLWVATDKLKVSALLASYIIKCWMLLCIRVFFPKKKFGIFLSYHRLSTDSHF
jgi:hypothetical protein